MKERKKEKKKERKGKRAVKGSSQLYSYHSTGEKQKLSHMLDIFHEPQKPTTPAKTVSMTHQNSPIAVQSRDSLSYTLETM